MDINQEIEKAKKRDKEAFTKIVQMYKQDLYKIARTRLNRVEDIEDALQETLLEAYNHIHTLKNNNSIKSWLISILIHKCNKVYKKNKITFISIEEDTEDMPNSVLMENSIEFENLLKPLKYEEKIIMVLYYALEYTTKEISKILHKKENTVKTIIRRGKEKIKREMEG